MIVIGMATICLIALILLIWFRTDAWLEYCRVFHLNYNAACNCWKAEQKQKLYDNCTMTYKNAVQNVVPKFKNEFLSKM